MRLLIVEDEKQMCDTVARSLYSAGYEVDTCYDGAEALECILAENYDLIVLDLNLPGMDAQPGKVMWYFSVKSRIYLAIAL